MKTQREYTNRSDLTQEKLFKHTALNSTQLGSRKRSHGLHLSSNNQALQNLLKINELIDGPTHQANDAFDKSVGF